MMKGPAGSRLVPIDGRKASVRGRVAVARRCETRVAAERVYGGGKTRQGRWWMISGKLMTKSGWRPRRLVRELMDGIDVGRERAEIVDRGHAGR